MMSYIDWIIMNEKAMNEKLYFQWITPTIKELIITKANKLENSQISIQSAYIGGVEGYVVRSKISTFYCFS